MDPVFISSESKRLRGTRRAINVATPAAGAEWVATVPGGFQWRLVGGTAQIVTSANVANRTLGFRVTSAATIVYENYFNNAIVASSTKTALYQQGTTLNLAASAGGLLVIPFIPMWLVPGDSFASHTVNLDVADQYSLVSLVIEELFDTNLSLSEHQRELAAEHAAEDAALTTALTGGTR